MPCRTKGQVALTDVETTRRQEFGRWTCRGHLVSRIRTSTSAPDTPASRSRPVYVMCTSILASDKRVVVVVVVFVIVVVDEDATRNGTMINGRRRHREGTPSCGWRRSLFKEEVIS